MVRALAKIILTGPGALWLWLVSGLPGPIGLALRQRYWRKRLKSLGANVRIDPGVHIQNPSYVSIGDNTWIDRGVIILAGADNSDRLRTLVANKNFPLPRGEVHLGSNIHISPQCIISGIGGIYMSDNCGLSAGVKMYSFSHHYRARKDPGNRDIHFTPQTKFSNQSMLEGPIFMGENVGVAVNAVILPGVSIAKDSFVAINSLVQSSFPENSLIAGSPAKRIKDRYVNTEEVSIVTE